MKNEKKGIKLVVKLKSREEWVERERKTQQYNHSNTHTQEKKERCIIKHCL